MHYLSTFLSPKVMDVYSACELYTYLFSGHILFTILGTGWSKIIYMSSPNKCVLCSSREIATGIRVSF